MTRIYVDEKADVILNDGSQGGYMNKIDNFDKKIFSNILQKIYKQYSNQREFAKITNVNRTYISKYINEKLEAPPSPKILKRLAKVSKGLSTYQELMKICGYLNDDKMIITMKSNKRESKLKQIINFIDGLTIDEFNSLKEEIKNAKAKINMRRNK